MIYNNTNITCYNNLSYSKDEINYQNNRSTHIIRATYMKVQIGKIINRNCIKGEVKVKSHSDFSDIRFQPGESVMIERQNGTALELKIASYRMHKGLHMLTFEGINNINDIEYLKGETLLQERDHEE